MSCADQLGCRYGRLRCTRTAKGCPKSALFHAHGVLRVLCSADAHVSAVCREVLQKEDELNEIVQLVGKDSLAESDKITLETARLIKEDFLQQNSFTSYDKYCPFYKSVEMMKGMVHFHRLATQAVERTAAGNADGQKVTFNLIKNRCACPLLAPLAPLQRCTM